MFKEKYTAEVTSTGEYLASDDFRTLWTYAHHWYRRSIANGNGAPEIRLLDGTVLFKDGKDVTVEEAEISIRLYSTLLRVSGRDSCTDMNMWELREMFVSDKFTPDTITRGILEELVETLTKWLGYDKEMIPIYNNLVYFLNKRGQRL